MLTQGLCPLPVSTASFGASQDSATPPAPHQEPGLLGNSQTGARCTPTESTRQKATPNSNFGQTKQATFTLVLKPPCLGRAQRASLISGVHTKC